MRSRWIWLLGALAIAAACSNGSRGISVSTRAVATQASAATTSVDAGPGVTVEKIRMVVRKLSVEGGACAAEDQAKTATTTAVDTTGTPESPGSQEEGDCEDEARFGPFYVELTGDALKGPVKWAFDAPVKAGTYEEVEVQINTIPVGMAGSDAGLQAMADAHASIVVDGKLDAGTTSEKSFSFSTPMAVEQEREGTIVVGDKPTNLTLDFDPSGWFTATGGGRLDPNDPTVRGQILANIRSSFRLTKDDD